LTGKLTPAQNVSNVKTALSIRTKKSLPGVPIDISGDEDLADGAL
jgi:hypothetical protein